MPTGKLAAQAGHAYTDALFACLDVDPDRAQAYRHGNGGSKVTLKAKNEAALRRAHDEAIAAGLPCALVVDSNHVLPPHFDGSPVVTALGIGPCTKAEGRAIAKRFNCVRNDRLVPANLASIVETVPDADDAPSVERWTPHIRYERFTEASVEMWPAASGEYVAEDDHLTALAFERARSESLLAILTSLTQDPAAALATSSAMNQHPTEGTNR